MNQIMKIDVMSKVKMDLLADIFRKHDIPTTVYYLKNGRKQAEWNESVNGFRIENGGGVIFQAHKKSAVVKFNKLPQEKRQSILECIQELDIARKSDYALGIILAVIFALIALVHIHHVYTTSEPPFVAAWFKVVGLLLQFISLAIIWQSRFKMGGNPMLTIGLVGWLVAWLFYSVWSSLTLPLGLALLRNKFPRKEKEKPNISLMEEQKHSGIGIASFILAIGSGVLFFLLLILAGALGAGTPRWDDDSLAVIIVGFFYVALIGMVLIGICLGVTGLFQKERKKIFAILGTVFSTMLLVVMTCL